MAELQIPADAPWWVGMLCLVAGLLLGKHWLGKDNLQQAFSGPLAIRDDFVRRDASRAELIGEIDRRVDAVVAERAETFEKATADRLDVLEGQYMQVCAMYRQEMAYSVALVRWGG